MARKIKVKLILQLREAGMSRNAIASSKNISRHSVSDVFRTTDEKNIHYSDVATLTDDEVYRLSTRIGMPTRLCTGTPTMLTSTKN